MSTTTGTTDLDQAVRDAIAAAGLHPNPAHVDQLRAELDPQQPVGYIIRSGSLRAVLGLLLEVYGSGDAGRGDHLPVRTATADEMPGLLRDKLVEEVGEYLAGDDPAELADVLEVLHALARVHGYDPQWLEQQRARKAEDRGGFAAGLVWSGTVEQVTR